MLGAFFFSKSVQISPNLDKYGQTRDLLDEIRTYFRENPDTEF